MSGRLNVFISDIHIGVKDNRTNWYQKEVHQKYLKAILTYIHDRGDQIQDLVILGDWFDLWNHIPEEMPSCLDKIFKDNEEIFNPSNDKGDFVSCLDSINGEFRFVNGNHDMSVGVEDLNKHFKPLSEKGRRVKGNTDFTKNITYTSQSGDVYAEHGHVYSKFCMPYEKVQNIYKPLPSGYYITRLVALLCKQQIETTGIENAAYLENSGSPTFGIADFLKDPQYFLRIFSTPLAKAVMFDLIEKAGKDPDKVIYKMLDAISSSTNIKATEAAKIFPERLDDPLHDVPLLVDALNTLHDPEVWRTVEWPVTQVFNKNRKYKVVIMGHTHEPELRKSKRNLFKGVYANAGYNCPDVPGMKQENVKISNRSLEMLRSKDMPRNVLEKLESIKDKEFWGEEKLLNILKTTIGQEQLARHQSIILEYAEKMPEIETSFKITDQSLEELERVEIPDTVIMKLASIKDKEIIGEENFLDTLKKTIGEEETLKCYRTIPKYALLKKSKKFPTFVEVEEKNGKYEVRLQKVDYPQTTISTIKQL